VEKARHRRGAFRWRAVVGPIIVVAAVTAAVVAFVPTGTPVTNDPPPANALSPAQTFSHADGLISDPFVLPTPRLDYMYSSGIDGVGQLHMPERTFTVMGHFSFVRDAMPTLPAWVEPNTGLWSPDVRKVGNVYVMWFSGHDWLYRLPWGHMDECIGIATSASPTGPFVSPSHSPAICQVSEYGDIDPRTFVAPDGQEWIYWKSDGNAGSLPTHIYGQRLASDGRTLTGPTVSLLTNDLPWEGPVIEAPQMVHVGNRYLLFFSGNISEGSNSGVGLALCQGPGGPCTSRYAGPWLGSNIQGAGPDEQTNYTQNGVTWMLYTPNAIYYPFAYPKLVAARVAFTATGMPYIADRQGMVPGITAGKDGQVGDS
jgi:hypothetical protein